VRVAGNVTFTGVLLVEGGVLGDLSCDADTKGTLVVGPSGEVSGAIKAPHIVVSGRVSGPSESSESIEIQSGACLVGDMSYRQIEVHAGGVIEGSLTPRLATYTDHVTHGRPDRSSGSLPARQHPDAGVAGFSRATRGRRVLGSAVALLVSATAAIWVIRDWTPPVPPPPGIALKSGSNANEPAKAQASAAEYGAPADATKGVAGSDPAPAPESAATGIVVASAAGAAGIDPDKVVAVQGVNPRKPARLFSVTSKEPSVLFRKKRQDPSGGTRIEIPAGATKTIPIGKEEIFRVAEGRNLTIFYQGRMVPPRTVEGGERMIFVPQSPGGAND